MTSLMLALPFFGPVAGAYGQVVSPPPGEQPVERSLTRGRFWLPDAYEHNVTAGQGGQYPGYHDGNNYVIHLQSSFFLNAKTNRQNYMVWRRNPVGGWCETPHQLVKNYNFSLSFDEPEEYTIGRCRSYDDTPDDEFLPLLFEIYTKRMVWSLPAYDDFVLTKQVVKNIDEAAWTDVYIGYNYVIHPSSAGDQRFSNDNEYVWAADAETFGDEDGVFVFYDDISWPGFSSGPATYPYPPGDETGDRGDPGNILDANSIDRRLYSPQAVAIGFVDASPNKDGRKKFWYSIRNSEGNQPWSHQNAPSQETVVWPVNGYNESVGVMTDDAPRMSWQEARQTNHPTAGNTWERTPLLTVGIGPFDLAPGDSVEFLMMFIGGELDPNISQHGGLEATSLLPDAAIGDLKQNWANAIELIKNNYRPTAYPPPTPGNVPQENHGDELLVNVFAETSPDNTPVQGYTISWIPVADGYVDPVKGTNDVAGYRLYRSIIGVEGPWELVREIPIDEADALTQEGRVKLRLESEPGIPTRFSVTTVDDDGLESGRTAYSLDPISAPRAPINDLSEVLVVPSPFRQVSGLLDPGEEKRLEFVNIPSKCTIRIYTVAGELVQLIDHEGFGSEAWGSSTGDNDNYMLTKWATNVMPGVYLYHITSHVPGFEGETTTGKFAIIK